MLKLVNAGLMRITPLRFCKLFCCALLMPACFTGCVSRRAPAHRIEVPANRKSVVREMEVTGYCACKHCCGWKRNWLGRPVFSSGTLKGRPKQVGRTASGKLATHGTIAADPRYPFGTLLFVENYGYGRVEDRGGDIKGNRLDLYFHSHAAANRWGRQMVKVRVWEP
jgi:3D (Asp-Asp-Asp) domain-containing protein